MSNGNVYVIYSYEYCIVTKSYNLSLDVQYSVIASEFIHMHDMRIVRAPVGNRILYNK